jgi:hypothetical protein
MSWAKFHELRRILEGEGCSPAGARSVVAEFATGATKLDIDESIDLLRRCKSTREQIEALTKVVRKRGEA